jgi:O-antigen ligase
MSTVSKFFSITLTLLFLAQEKLVIGGIPFYALEIAFIGIIFILFKERGDLQKSKTDKIVLLGVVLLLMGAFLSTVLHPWGYLEMGRLKSWFLFPVAYFLVGVYFFAPQKRALLWASWFLGSSFIALLGLYGYFRGYITYDERLAFPYASPNFLAYLVIPGILSGLFFLGKTFGWKQKGVIVLTVSSIVVLFLTHSYNAWLALFASLLVAFLFKLFLHTEGQSLKMVLIIGCIVGVASLFILSEKDEAKWANLYHQEGRSSLDSRLMIWQSALAIGKDYPLNGIGVGNFQEVYLKYQEKFPPYLEWAVPQPHNFFLAFWLQTGLLGLLGIMLLFLRLGQVFCSKIRNADKADTESFLLIALWVSFFSYGLFDTPYFRNDLAFLFWVQVLLTIMYGRSQDKEAFV